MRQLSLSIAAGLFAVMSGSAFAAVTPAEILSPVLDSCPIADNGDCVTAVQQFIATRSAAEADLNDELVDLVAALAYAAKNPNITPALCVELEDGIRAAGRALTFSAAKASVKSIADNLCGGANPTPSFSLASDNNNGGDDVPPGGNGGGGDDDEGDDTDEGGEGPINIE